MNKQELIISLPDNTKIQLSRELLDKQKAWHNLDLIKKMIITRAIILHALEKEKRIDKCKEYNKILDTVALKLQKLYKFKPSGKYVRFWERPKCTCPKEENEALYPQGNYLYSSECILHT